MTRNIKTVIVFCSLFQRYGCDGTPMFGDCSPDYRYYFTMYLGHGVEIANEL